MGGGTKNLIWSQTTSDVSGLNQILRKKTIGASYGDAFLSACTIGELKKDDINKWNELEYEIIADKRIKFDFGDTGSEDEIAYSTTFILGSVTA